MDNRSTTKKSVVIEFSVLDKDAIRNIQTAEKEITRLKEANAALSKQGKKNTEEYIANESAIKNLSKTIRLNQKVLQDNIDKWKSEEGSLAEMRAELKGLNSEYAQLSKTERESASGTELRDKIKNLTDELKKLEKATGDSTRNVGNYPESIQQALEEPVKSARAQLRELIFSIQSMALELNKSKGAIEGQKAVVDSLAASVGTESQEYQEAAQKLREMQDAYDTTQQKMNEMEQTAGEMRDTIGDVNTRINSFANDEQKVAAAQEGISVLTSSYTILQSAVAALGGDEEKLLQVYAKVQLVQQSINSLMTIYKALNHDSNLMIVARQKLESARLAFTKAYNAALQKQNAETVANTVAEGANATATAASAVAATAATTAHFSLGAAIKAVTAAIAANPLGAIILGITAAVTGLVKVIKKLTSASKEAAEKEKQHAEQMKKAQKDYADSIKDTVSAQASLTKKYDEQIAKTKALYAVVKSESASYKEKKAAMNELNKIVPKYNGQLSKTGTILKENKSAIDDYISKLREKAQAEANTEMLVQAYIERGQIQRRKLQAEQDKKYAEARIKIYQDAYNTQMSFPQNQRVSAVKLSNMTKEINYQKEKLEIYNATIKETNSELQKANKNVAAVEKIVSTTTGLIDAPKSTTKQSDNKGDKKDGKDNEADAAKKIYDEAYKYAQDYYKKLEELRVSSLESKTDQEMARYKAEVKAIQEQIDKLNANADQILSNPNIDPRQYDKLLDNLNNALSEAAKINEKNIAEIQKDDLEAFAAITDKLKSELSKDGASELDLLRINLQEDLAALKTEEDAILASKEYTEEQKTELQKLYAEKRRKLTKNETAAEKRLWIEAGMNIASAVSNSIGELQNMFAVIAEDNEEMQKYSKALALGQIAISAAVATAQAVVAAINAGKDTGIGAAVAIPLFLAEFAGIVAGVIAQAKSVLSEANIGSKPRFAQGGLVHGQDGVDKVDAKLTAGEYVITKKRVKELGIPFLDALNFTDVNPIKNLSGHYNTGGVVQSSVQNVQNLEIDYSQLSEIFKQAVAEVSPIVSVKEISNVQNRVKVKESIARK